MKFVTLPTSTGQAKFTFDDEGHMLYGWIDESGEMLTDDDAWKSGMYYCSDNGDGRMATDRKSTRLNSSHLKLSRMPSSA